MTKNLFILLFSIISTTILAQEKLKSTDISEFVYTFEINNDSLIGIGKKILEDKISKSQFLLLGEQHYSPEISEFTNVLLPKLSDLNFKYFAVEIGPNSAKKMKQIMKEDKSLFQFNSEFYSKYKNVPIPFFDGKKDEIFLKTALNENFEIWGVDQEYFSSQLFLIDEIYNLSNNKPLVKPYYENSKKFIEEEFENDAKAKNYPLFTNYLKSSILKSFFEKCNAEEQKTIINDLITSWEIYALNEKKRYRENNHFRMEYMKRKLGENYKRVEKSDSLPKVLVKMGSMHLVRGKNWLGNYDLGNTFKELAYFNGTQSTSINCFARFYENDDGSIYDYLEDEEGKAYQPILELAKKDKWVLIDTKPILDIVREKKIKLSKDLKILLTGFDFVLFSPTKTNVKPNYLE